MTRFPDAEPGAGARMRRHVGAIIDFAAGFLTPLRCRVCGAPLFNHANPHLCHACLATIKWIRGNACPRCGWPSGPYAVPNPDGCGRCRGRNRALNGTICVARYRAAARTLVKKFKFGREYRLASVLSALMAARWRAAGLAADVLVPVPLHPLRLRERGYDQVALLAAGVARETGLPLHGRALVRTRYTPPQALLRRGTRLGNLEGAFAADTDFGGKSVLLVDDVFTTGATLEACAAACKQAGAGKAYALTFAR